MSKNCHNCKDDSIITISQPQQPFCEQCGDDNTCLEKLDSKCVIYHLETEAPSKLGNLGLPNKVSAETIFEKINDLLGTQFNVPIVSIPSPTVEILTSGTADHKLQANVKISANSGNIIRIESDGLFVPDNFSGKVKVNASDAADYLVNQLMGGTDGIVSNSAIPIAGVLQIQPSINLNALVNSLSTNPAFKSLICRLIQECLQGCPTIDDIIITSVTV